MFRMAGTAEAESFEPRYMPLPAVLAAAATGIAIDRYCPLAVSTWLPAATFFLLAWLPFFICRRNKPAIAIILLAVACLAGAWHHFRWSLVVENNLALLAPPQIQHPRSPHPVCLRAEVTGGPRRLPAPPYDPMRIVPAIDRTRLELRIMQCRDGGCPGGNTWRSAGGRATLLVDGHVLGIHAGDLVEVFATLQPAAPPRNPGQFDFATHLRAEGKLAVLRAARPQCVQLLEASTPSGPSQSALNPWHLPARARAAGHRVLCRYLGARQQGLANALLLGSRDQLARQERDTFAETGTVHLLAVSGLHVSILALMVLLVTRLFRLPHARGLLVVAVVTIAYTLLTGSHPPVVRAAVLVLIMCLAYALARRTTPYNSLAAAALVVLALNPAELFRVGAQLSFLAVASIIFFWPLIKQKTDEDTGDPLKRLLREGESPPKKAARRLWRWYLRAMLVSLAIWLVALPLIMARFHLLSPGSIILTPLLIPPVTAALGSGLIVLACGWLMPPVAIVAAWFCNWSLLLIQWIVDLAHSFPGSHFWVAGPAEWWLFGFYGGLGLLLVFPRLRPGRRRFAALLAAWIAVGLAVSFAGRSERKLACTFLSVGHGCATVVELPDGRNILYDAGHFSSPGSCAQTIAGCLWSRGITHLDAVVLSHADADHYNGLPQLMKMISIGAVYVSPRMFDDSSSSLLALREAIQAAGIPVRHLQAGDRLEVHHAHDDYDQEKPDDNNRCRIEVLHPGDTESVDNKTSKRKKHDNAASIVLLLSYQGRRILLPGDIEPPGLDKLLAREPVDCDVLLVPHHGSGNSDPPGLAAWCKPEVAVVSGSLARYNTHTETAYKTARQIFHTGRHGAVRVQIENGRVEADCYLKKQH